MSIYDKSTDDFNRYTHSVNNPYSLNSDYIITFFEDSNNIMWVGTFSGVNRWDPNMATFSQYSLQTNPEVQNFNITSFAQFDEKHLVFSAYSGGIYQLSLIDNSISSVSFSDFFTDFRVMNLLADGNTLWVGTRASGLFQVDLATNEITKFQNNADDEKSISANSITDIIKDRHGSIWVSTFHQGINRLNKDGSFTRFLNNEITSNLGPSSNHILQLLEDEMGIIWLATFGGGLNRFDPKTEKFLHLKHDEKK